MNDRDKATLVRLVKDHELIEALVSDLQPLFGDCFEGQLLAAVFRAMENYTTAVEESLGDDDRWIRWFIYETDCGKGRLECDLGDGKGFRTIASVDDLIKLLDDAGEAAQEGWK